MSSATSPDDDVLRKVRVTSATFAALVTTPRQRPYPLCRRAIVLAQPTDEIVGFPQPNSLSTNSNSALALVRLREHARGHGHRRIHSRTTRDKWSEPAGAQRADRRRPQDPSALGGGRAGSAVREGEKITWWDRFAFVLTARAVGADV